MTQPPSEINQEPPTTSQPQMVQVPVPGGVKTPSVTYVLLGLTILVYLLQLLSQSLFGQNIDLPVIFGSKVNSLILQGEVWRLITPVLLHGSILHIGFNMYALFVLGPSLERAYGHWRYLTLYLLGAFAGNTLSFLFSPSNSLGASTAIFGLVGAEVVFIYLNRKMFGTRAKGMLINLGVIILVNLTLGLNPGIDNWGHLGGLLGGTIFAWIAGPVYQLAVGPGGYELQDIHAGSRIKWGALLTFGIFAAVVIGRMLAG
jgi:rhomboid protease GluP